MDNEPVKPVAAVSTAKRAGDDSRDVATVVDNTVATTEPTMLVVNVPTGKYVKIVPLTLLRR